MGLELADSFRCYGNWYRQKYASRMPSTHLKAMQAIEQCRTEALGGQVYRCPDCEQVQYSYHSSRRASGRCVVTAIALNAKTKTHKIGWRNNRISFCLCRIFWSPSPSLQGSMRLLAVTKACSTTYSSKPQSQPRNNLPRIGMVGVLHTWGRNLAYHPHIHYLVPAGGLAPDGNTWLAARHEFLLPVRALSRIFRGKLLDALRRTVCYKSIPAKVWQPEWVVHCEPVGSGLGALKYLAPYTPALHKHAVRCKCFPSGDQQ